MWKVYLEWISLGARRAYHLKSRHRRWGPLFRSLIDRSKGEVQLGFGFTTTPAKADKDVDVAYPPSHTTLIHCSVYGNRVYCIHSTQTA